MAIADLMGVVGIQGVERGVSVLRKEEAYETAERRVIVDHQNCVRRRRGILLAVRRSFTHAICLAWNGTIVKAF
jgi:hypothetical protein